MSSTAVKSRTRHTARPDRIPPAPEDPGIFARESHLDQRAYLAGADPVAYRLALADDGRLAAVIQAAARRFGWQFPWYPAGGPASWAKGGLRRGAGIAAGVQAGLRVATCAEVCADAAGQLRVTRIVTAYERGPAREVVSLELSPASAPTAPLIALAPAIANAIFAATGLRLPSPSASALTHLTRPASPSDSRNSLKPAS